MQTTKSLFSEVLNNPGYSSKLPPVVEESLFRTEYETSDYRKWLASTEPKKLADWLKVQYARFYQKHNSTSDGIDFKRLTNSGCFLIHCGHLNYSTATFTWVFDWLKDRVLSMGYSLDVAETHLFDRPDWVETHHRYHFKPVNNDNSPGKYFQDISIQFLLKNDFPVQIKFQANARTGLKNPDTSLFKKMMKALEV